MSSEHGISPTAETQPQPVDHKSRVWLITAGTSPIAISLARRLIDRGDDVVAGIPNSAFLDPQETEREFNAFYQDIQSRPETKSKLRYFPYHIRSVL